MERNRVAVLICVFSSYLVSLKILSAANETAAQSVHNSTIDSHGFLFGDSSWLNETESTEEFNSNTSFVLTNLTTTDNTNSEYWDINNQKGVMKRQNLRFRKIGSKDYVTCYEMVCTGNGCLKGAGATQRFCYPSIIVTGMAKCGTSAMYEMLSRFPNTMLMRDKENCPYYKERPHQLFFLSMPRYERVKQSSLIIDGCIDVEKNMMLRKLLREPQTVYILMTRNYADMMWSAYNFYCLPDYDGYLTCESSRWVVQHIHKRSVGVFHDLITADANGTLVSTPMKKNICKSADRYFSDILLDKLWTSVPRNRTLAIASEELELYPDVVWGKVTKLLNLPPATSKLMLAKQIGNFGKIRVNVQEENRSDIYHMERQSISKAKYQPGLFKISGNKPMRNESREILNSCWKQDCVLTSQATGYLYPACMTDILELIRTGAWRSFNEVYRTSYPAFVHPISLSGIGYETYLQEQVRILNMKKKKSRKGKGPIPDISNFNNPYTWQLAPNQ